MKKAYYIASIMYFVMTLIIFGCALTLAIVNLVKQPHITFFGVALGVIVLGLCVMLVVNAYKEMRAEHNK